MVGGSVDVEDCFEHRKWCGRLTAQMGLSERTRARETVRDIPQRPQLQLGDREPVEDAAISTFVDNTCTGELQLDLSKRIPCYCLGYVFEPEALGRQRVRH